MNVAFGVHKTEDTEDFLDDFFGIINGKFLSLFLDESREVSSIDEVQHKVNSGFAFIDFMKF
jgi:hypothetical protein